MRDDEMRLTEALGALDEGHKVRRQGWHNGMMFVSMEKPIGVNELYITQFTRGVVMPWPLHLRPGDWLADDWIIVKDQDIPHFTEMAQPGEAKPSQAGPKRKPRSKRPKGPSAESKP
jgi:hypothetical protein